MPTPYVQTAQFVAIAGQILSLRNQWAIAQRSRTLHQIAGNISENPDLVRRHINLLTRNRLIATRWRRGLP